MIGVLVFPNFQLLDAAGPISVFEIAARFAGQPPSIRVLAATPGLVKQLIGRRDARARPKGRGRNHAP